MMLNKNILGLLLVIPALVSASVTTEPQERISIEQQAISFTVKKDWESLDQLILAYNKGFPATSGGTQKLLLVWNGIYGAYSRHGIRYIAEQWLKARPHSTGAKMLQAMIFHARAANLRGEGATITVPLGVWPEYKKLMVEEEKFLLKNKVIADKDATWYLEMEIVARNLGDKNLLYSTLKEGSNRYPTYQNIYLQAMEGRLPKWGGSANEIEKIARMATEKNKQSSGFSYYAYIWYNAVIFQPELMVFLSNHLIVSWDDMKKGLWDRYKQFPSTRMLNNILISSCIANDKLMFLKADNMLRGETEPDIWPQNISYRSCQSSFLPH